MEELVTLHIYAEDYDAIKSWQLTGWCKKQGADDWTVSVFTSKVAGAASFRRFDELTDPFRLPAAKRRRLTAYGKVFGSDAFIQKTELWRLTSTSLGVLQGFLPDGLFTYQMQEDEWLEDPVFYRNGEFMLGVVSHENEGIIRVTETERSLLEAEGFVVRSHGSYVGY